MAQLRERVRRRDARLVPVAAFADPDVADEAWLALDDAGIPASVVTEPATFGSAPVTRVYVARIHAEEAQRAIAAIVNR
jgi:hypothetical protein